MLNVRAARPEDHRALGALEAEVHALHAAGDSHSYRPALRPLSLDEFTEELGRRIYLVLEDETGLLGYAQCGIARFEGERFVNDQKILLLDAIAVARSQEGRGYGRRLYEAVEARARAEACGSLELNVSSFNGTAMAFYRAMGMDPIRVRMRKLL